MGTKQSKCLQGSSTEAKYKSSDKENVDVVFAFDQCAMNRASLLKSFNINRGSDYQFVREWGIEAFTERTVTIPGESTVYLLSQGYPDEPIRKRMGEHTCYVLQKHYRLALCDKSLRQLNEVCSFHGISFFEGNLVLKRSEVEEFYEGLNDPVILMEKVFFLSFPPKTTAKILTQFLNFTPVILLFEQAEEIYRPVQVENELISHIISKVVYNLRQGMKTFIILEGRPGVGKSGMARLLQSRLRGVKNLIEPSFILYYPGLNMRDKERIIQALRVAQINKAKGHHAVTERAVFTVPFLFHDGAEEAEARLECGMLHLKNTGFNPLIVFLIDSDHVAWRNALIDKFSSYEMTKSVVSNGSIFLRAHPEIDYVTVNVYK